MLENFNELVKLMKEYECPKVDDIASETYEKLFKEKVTQTKFQRMMRALPSFLRKVV